MITEDYVLFETAKFLKEKGFGQNCATYYLDGQVWRHYHGEVIPKGKQIYAAPTQAVVMKWLREVHNIIISPYALSLGYYFEIFDLTNRDITGCKPLYKVGIPNKEDILSTYEKACEAAIKYCLENLI